MDVAELQRQVEYKFAPEPLIALQGLANTYSFEDDEERLADPEATRRWLIETDLGAEEIQVGEAEHERLCEFRATVRSMLESNLSGEPADVDAGALADFAGAGRVALRSVPGGGLELDLSPAGSVDDVIALMLGIVHRSQLTGEWARLKVCGADDCRWAFFDTSKNRGGHWCSMELCGNREKNRRYRGRQSARD